MKTGILTWYDVLNYGSAFQAYALQKTVEDLGGTGEILIHDRILPDYYENRLKSKDIMGVLKWIRNQSPNRRKYRSTTKAKSKKFKEFYNDYLNIGAKYCETDSDFVLLGSDQIFDVKDMFYPFQFGGDVSCDSISTYAPCFGETTYEKLCNHPNFEQIKSLCQNLKVVNARNENTKFILEKLTGRNVDLVLDPTLLYTFNNEKAMWNKRLIKENYCIIYTILGNSTTKEFAEACCEFARKNNLKLVSVGEPRLWCDIQYSSASPIEFFELFMHADMVLTNTFHGTCFSIIMNKPFYAFSSERTENKLGGMLKQLDLRAQWLEEISELPMTIPNIDYHSLEKTLKINREISINSLKNALSNINT